MLYIFYGTNEQKARIKAKELIGGLQKKAPDAELVRITDGEVDDVTQSVDIMGLLGTQGLFKQNYLLYLDGVDNVILGFSDIQLDAMKQSSHICIALMGKLTPKQKSQVEKYANKITEYKLGSEASKSMSDSFDVFTVANALKDRSKPKLWQALSMARLSGSNGEAIVGMMFWAVKDMLIKRQLRNYTEQELKSMAIKLAGLPSLARKGRVSIHNALEEFALSSI
jgi:hypothetical protein